MGYLATEHTAYLEYPFFQSNSLSNNPDLSSSYEDLCSEDISLVENQIATLIHLVYYFLVPGKQNLRLHRARRESTA